MYDGEIAMKYKRCPRCEMNYILEDQQLCKVCLDELNGRKSIFDEEDSEKLICPFCEKNVMGIDDFMCSECRAKRAKKNNDNV